LMSMRRNRRGPFAPASPWPCMLPPWPKPPSPPQLLLAGAPSLVPSCGGGGGGGGKCDELCGLRRQTPMYEAWAPAAVAEGGRARSSVRNPDRRRRPSSRPRNRDELPPLPPPLPSPLPSPLPLPLPSPLPSPLPPPLPSLLPSLSPPLWGLWWLEAWCVAWWLRGRARQDATSNGVRLRRRWSQSAKSRKPGGGPRSTSTSPLSA
jgi:hypothetical protein